MFTSLSQFEWRKNVCTARSCVTVTIHLEPLTLTARLVSPADSSALLNYVQFGLWILKNEASVHSKPTMSGVSCLPPRSVPLYLSLPRSLSFSVVDDDEPLQWEKDFDPLA